MDSQSKSVIGGVAAIGAAALLGAYLYKQYGQKEDENKNAPLLPIQLPPAPPSVPTDDNILAMARQFCEWGQNKDEIAALRVLMGGLKINALRELFYPRIAFGTAGLRAKMSPGYACMNDLVVIQTTQGLCDYIEEQNPNAKTAGVVVGYDGRHNSKRYAELVAAVFMYKKIPVYLFNRLAATPLVPFAVMEYKAAAGVMITASHNPKDDNGYKVFWSNGAQIIPPHDLGIAKAISTNLRPWTEYTFEAKHELLRDPTAEIGAKYFSEIAKRYSFHKKDNKNTKLRVTYTAMHGVGAHWVTQAFEAFGLHPYIPCKEQVEPDADFSTVRFPNPEEGKGALALAMKAAEANNSPIILANDPDADRLAVAEFDSKKGEWAILNGNEIALLFADWVWTKYLEANPSANKSKAVMLSSTVSSQVLKAMAKKEGFHFEDTLTGFKWMGNVAADREKEGYNFLFAFEVEIGFLIGNLSLDKDGVRAAAVLNELAIQLYNNGKTMSGRLLELYDKYGYFSHFPSYFFCDAVAKLDKVFGRLRTGFNGTYPTSCGPHKITSVRDVTTGFDSSQPNKVSLLPKQSDSHMITFYFENGCVATLRNSGTEPKLKYYVECSGATRAEADKQTKMMVDAIIEHFMQPEVFGLVAKSA